MSTRLLIAQARLARRGYAPRPRPRLHQLGLPSPFSPMRPTPGWMPKYSRFDATCCVKNDETFFCLTFLSCSLSLSLAPCAFLHFLLSAFGENDELQFVLAAWDHRRVWSYVVAHRHGGD